MSNNTIILVIVLVALYLAMTNQLPESVGKGINIKKIKNISKKGLSEVKNVSKKGVKSGKKLGKNKNLNKAFKGINNAYKKIRSNPTVNKAISKVSQNPTAKKLINKASSWWKKVSE